MYARKNAPLPAHDARWRCVFQGNGFTLCFFQLPLRQGRPRKTSGSATYNMAAVAVGGCDNFERTNLLQPAVVEVQSAFTHHFVTQPIELVVCHATDRWLRNELSFMKQTLRKADEVCHASAKKWKNTNRSCLHMVLLCTFPGHSGQIN